MPTVSIAYLCHNNQDIVIAPMEPEFARLTQAEQQELIRDLQRRAEAAHLAGPVVPVWEDGDGMMAFIAPPVWHPFLQTWTMLDVWANVNRELYW
jgi:hypothetical protein